VPTQLKIVRGDPGKRGINRNEPQSETVAPDLPAPEHLGEIATECWVHMVAMLSNARVITELDLHGLELYCVSYETWREATLKVAATGALVKSPKSGYPVQSPYFAIANKAHEQMVKLAAEFGLTPSSRSRVTVVGAKKTVNPFSQI